MLSTKYQKIEVYRNGKLLDTIKYSESLKALNDKTNRIKILFDKHRKSLQDAIDSDNDNNIKAPKDLFYETEIDYRHFHFEIASIIACEKLTSKEKSQFIDLVKMVNPEILMIYYT